MKNKTEIFEEVSTILKGKGFRVISIDDKRPWGGFFVIDESQDQLFINHFFPDVKFEDVKISEKLSPKILIVAPGHRLSWQYHKRRSEIWKCIGGRAEVIASDTDEEKTKHLLMTGDIIKLKQGERHRLVGLDDWGLIAEIWQHTDPSNPSDEEDIIRVQDDYKRK